MVLSMSYTSQYIEAEKPCKVYIGSTHVDVCQALAFVNKKAAWPLRLLCSISHVLPGSLTLQLQT